MTHTLTYRIHEVAPYINWIYFFHAWGFPPRFAASALAVLSTHTSRTERISIPPFLPGFEPGILVYSTTFFRFIKPCGSKKAAARVLSLPQPLLFLF
mgnify:CR=1 FL=1